MKKQIMFWIKFPYWLGIVADGLWAIALLIPSVFGILSGNSDFNPDLQTRLIMGIGGSLMAGWTFLLYWAVRKPIERRTISLLTAFPVVFGILLVTLIGFMENDTGSIWILIKLISLIVLLVTSYVLASKVNKNN